MTKISKNIFTAPWSGHDRPSPPRFGIWKSLRAAMIRGFSMFEIPILSLVALCLAIIPPWRSVIAIHYAAMILLKSRGMMYWLAGDIHSARLVFNLMEKRFRALIDDKAQQYLVEIHRRIELTQECMEEGLKPAGSSRFMCLEDLVLSLKAQGHSGAAEDLSEVHRLILFELGKVRRLRRLLRLEDRHDVIARLNMNEVEELNTRMKVAQSQFWDLRRQVEATEGEIHNAVGALNMNEVEELSARMKEAREQMWDVRRQVEDATGEIHNAVRALKQALGGENLSLAAEFSKISSELTNILKIEASLKSESLSLSEKAPEKSTDRVHFAVTSPVSVAVGSMFVLNVWAFLEFQRNSVLEQARRFEGGAEVSHRSKGPTSITRGTILRVQLSIDNLVVEEQEDWILWDGEVANADFVVKVPMDMAAADIPGQATIYLEGLRLTRLHFIIHVRQTASREISDLQAAGQRYRKAFASYASADRDEVLARIQGAKKAAPELDVFMDVLSLRSGENWEERLWDVIPKSDIFYLFWSLNAKQSEWVEKEWRCALRTRGLEFIDPVPLVSPEQVPPPSELSSIHFSDPLLAHMRTKT
jgi:hypothetical protein